MQIYTTTSAKKAPFDLIILPLFLGQDPNEIFKKHFGESLNADVVTKDFKNKTGSTQLVYGMPDFKKRILLLGLGESKKFNFEIWRQAIQSAINTILNIPIENVILIIPIFKALDINKYLELTAFSLVFSAYRFNEYKHPEPEEVTTKIKAVYLLTKASGSRAKKAVVQGVMIGTAVNSARDLSNHPANIATPSHLAKHAYGLAKLNKFSCKILDANQIKQEGMGLITGVGQGSAEPAKFIILEYGNKKQPPIVLVGKGLTFDSGGVSIKPSEKMEEMKYDMAGGADVIAIFEAASRLKLSLHLVGIVPAVENLPSGTATRPGDVLTAHNGKTVEVINTDAEGRMVLADTISYAKKYYNPKLILEYSTLTGAIVAALGDQLTGYFSNTENLKKSFILASKFTGENFWPMPLEEKYNEQLKSQIADFKNVGEKGAGGAITAALFLQNFVGKTPWVHFDIAGTAWTTQSKPHLVAGATGWGVYLTIEFLRNL